MESQRSCGTFRLTVQLTVWRRRFVGSLRTSVVGSTMSALTCRAPGLPRARGRTLKDWLVAAGTATPFVDHWTVKLCVAGRRRLKLKDTAWVVVTEKVLVAGEKACTGRTFWESARERGSPQTSQTGE